MKIAVLSDIHGNRWALEAAVEDFISRGGGPILNLGDSLYGPLDPAGTADMLIGLDVLSVRGNEDRILLPYLHKYDAYVAQAFSLDFTLGRLEPVHLEWLESLPRTTVWEDELYLCHGTPDRDDEYLLNKVENGRLVPREKEDIAGRLAGIACRTTLCGHDHMPECRTLPDGRLLVNPGSVGLPAFRDTGPEPHSVSNQAPPARYSLLSRAGDTWEVFSIPVFYDWETAALTAAKNGRSDWAEWLRTGRA
jgi:predicted phosphodiesterase